MRKINENGLDVLVAEDNKYITDGKGFYTRINLISGMSESDFKDSDTNEMPEVSNYEELRQEAYKSEADQYLIAYNGYIIEGKLVEAEKQKQLYLAKKEEIRLRYAETI